MKSLSQLKTLSLSGSIVHATWAWWGWSHVYHYAYMHHSAHCGHVANLYITRTNKWNKKQHHSLQVPTSEHAGVQTRGIVIFHSFHTWHILQIVIQYPLLLATKSGGMLTDFTGLYKEDPCWKGTDPCDSKRRYPKDATEQPTLERYSARYRKFECFLIALQNRSLVTRVSVTEQNIMLSYCKLYTLPFSVYVWCICTVLSSSRTMQVPFPIQCAAGLMCCCYGILTGTSICEEAGGIHYTHTQEEFVCRSGDRATTRSQQIQTLVFIFQMTSEAGILHT